METANKTPAFAELVTALALFAAAFATKFAITQGRRNSK